MAQGWECDICGVKVPFDTPVLPRGWYRVSWNRPCTGCFDPECGTALIALAEVCNLNCLREWVGRKECVERLIDSLGTTLHLSDRVEHEGFRGKIVEFGVDKSGNALVVLRDENDLLQCCRASDVTLCARGDYTPPDD